MSSSLRLRAAVLSIAIFLAFIGAWHLATRGTSATASMSPEYARLMGITATQGKSAMPGPGDVGAKLWEHLKRPFYDNGPNDKGLGIQLGYSIARVLLGYFLAVIVAVPFGFLIGMSPLLNKALDRRHRVALNQFDKADSADAVRHLWDAALQRGDIPGAYWAVLTHPASTDSLVRDVFGQVHMLSHLVGAANRADIRRLSQLEAEKSELEAKVARQQAQLRDAIVGRDETIRNLNNLLAKAISATRESAEGAPPAEAEQATMTRLVEDLERRLSAETRRRARAEERIATLETRVSSEAELRAAAQAQAQALRGELAALEATLAEPVRAGSADPDVPIDLRGLSLLYVGGRTDHVSRMRASAERCGATLAHHDGGVEESNGLLAGLIQRADAVLFPVDCVSHQATWLVKRLCRQAGKSFVPLRSAGLGSFLAALRDPAVGGMIRTLCH